MIDTTTAAFAAFHGDGSGSLEPIPAVAPTSLAPSSFAPAGDASAPDARIRFIVGGEGDDHLVLEGAGTGVGGGGADIFTLVSSGLDYDGPEYLGTVLDFGDDDNLDLSQLGASASVLGRESLGNGGTRISIDFDGDGVEDGFLITRTDGELPPDDGVFTIQPFPLPGDGDGEMTILPYPMPGDGEVTILPFPLPGEGGGLAATSWIVG